MSVINIGGKLVGPGHPTFVIAEAGSNHGRNLDQAKALIDVAVEAGADAVKFQTFSAKTLYSKYTPRFSYLEAQGHTKDTYDILEEAELPREWQPILFDYAKEKGILWISTPTDRAGVDQLDALGVPAFKISSYEAVDLPFVRYVASKGKPLIISTGMCTSEEIGHILASTMHGNKVPVALLQCTSLYPAPYHLANLAAIPRMGEFHFLRDDDNCQDQYWLRVNPVVGLSDHTDGWHIPVVAVAMGASIIEKHFTLDRNLPGPDHRHSLEPHELKAMVKQIRDVEAALGDGVKRGPAPEEQEMYLKARRSVVAACDIPAGTVITEAMVTSKRPGYGIPARDIGKVIGKTAKVDIREDEVMEWRMVE